MVYLTLEQCAMAIVDAGKDFGFIVGVLGALLVILYFLFLWACSDLKNHERYLRQTKQLQRFEDWKQQQR